VRDELLQRLGCLLGAEFLPEAKAPLMRLTSQIAMASCDICAIKATTPPTHNNIAIKWVKLDSNFT
jgi:hypothetical protein